MRTGTWILLHGFMRHGLLDYTSVLCASRVQLTYGAISIVVAISFIPLSTLVADPTPTACCTGNSGAECKSTSKPVKTGYPISQHVTDDAYLSLAHHV